MTLQKSFAITNSNDDYLWMVEFSTGERKKFNWKQYFRWLKFVKGFFLFLFFLVFLFFSKVAGSEQDGSWLKQLDLDFEKQTLSGWTVSSTGYHIALDTSKAASGKQCLLFHSRETVQSWRDHPCAVAAVHVAPGPFKGKRLRLSASLSTAQAPAGLSLFIRADAGEDENRDPAAFTQMSPGQRPRGDTDWKVYYIELDIPNETTVLSFGAVFYGTGKGWIDNIKVENIPAQGMPLLEIAGRVTGKEKKPVAGALVVVKNFYRKTALEIKKTGQDGTFRFRLPQGYYWLTSSHPGYRAAALPPRYYAKDEKQLEFSLIGETGGLRIEGKIQGSIPDSSRAHTYIVAKRLDYIGTELFYASPGKDGSFNLTVPPGEPYKIYLDSPGVMASPLKISPGNQEPCILAAAQPQPATPQVIDWLKQTAIPLKTVRAGSGYKDLQPLKKVVGTARVLGLGETTHGTREIFQMKHRLLEFLATEMDFTIFALEAPFCHGLVANEYILTGCGDPQEILALLGWETEEMLELLEWMKAYNKKEGLQRKLQFYGADITGSLVGPVKVQEFLNKVDPAFAREEKTRELLILLSKDTAAGKIYRYPEAQRAALKTTISSLLQQLEQEREKYTAKSSKREWSIARQTVFSLQYFIEYMTTENDYDGINIRDKGMAENIGWMLTSTPGAKVVYWGHNFHISKAQYPGHPYIFAGIHLKRMLGDDYRAIGFLFDRGSFQARDFTPGGWRIQGAVKSFSVESIPGSYGAAMARTGYPFFFLDLRHLPGTGEVADWFAAPHIFKWVDSIYAGKRDIQHLFRLPPIFDAVIFIRETHRARPLAGARIPPFQ